jgi:NhaP-type Na+/H+ or K+/H+ antiporter
MALGAAGGLVGGAALYALYRYGRFSEILETLGTFGILILVVAVCDALQDETGLLTAVLMGMAVANLPGIARPSRDPFLDSVVQQGTSSTT